VLKAPGNNALSEHFCFRRGIVGSGSISENSGKLRYFGKPAAIFEPVVRR